LCDEGFYCKDGVVIGTDSSATFSLPDGRQTIEQPVEKIHLVDERIIIAGTGAGGLGQRFCEVVRKAWVEKIFTGSEFCAAKHISRATLVDFDETCVRNVYNPYGIPYGALVAFSIDGTHHLCEFEVGKLQPEFKTRKLWYCSMGCTQLITDSFLGLMRKVFWNDGTPTLKEGAFVAVWALEHAIDVNPGGVNGPIQLAILERDGKGRLKARMVSDDELDEHRQNIEAAEKALCDSQLNESERSHNQIPDVPKPKSE